MAGVVSMEEFSALQSTLMKLKEEKYEALEREKKLKKEVERLTKLQQDNEAQLKKQNGICPHRAVGDFSGSRRVTRQACTGCEAISGLGRP